MDWLHCNKCTTRKSGSNRFYITNCRHVFCNFCIDLTSPTCSACTTKCKVLELNKDMPHSVKTIFSSKDGQLGAYKESVKFQNDQMLSFIQKHKGSVQEYQKKKEAVLKMKEQLNALSRALNKERELVEKLQGAFKKYPGTVSPRTFNDSPISPGILNVSSPINRTPDANRTRSSGFGSLSGSSGVSVPGPSPSSASVTSFGSLGSSGSTQGYNKPDMYRKMMEAKRQRDGK